MLKSVDHDRGGAEPRRIPAGLITSDAEKRWSQAAPSAQAGTITRLITSDAEKRWSHGEVQK